MGKGGLAAFESGLFRKSGEVHRWMYDRYSLRTLCFEVGFEAFEVCQADQSRIDQFSQFGLDAVDGRPRKPDSLFVECVKPIHASARKVA